MATGRWSECSESAKGNSGLPLRFNSGSTTGQRRIRVSCWPGPGLCRPADRARGWAAGQRKPTIPGHHQLGLLLLQAACSAEPSRCGGAAQGTAGGPSGRAPGASSLAWRARRARSDRARAPPAGGVAGPDLLAGAVPTGCGAAFRATTPKRFRRTPRDQLQGSGCRCEPGGQPSKTDRFHQG